MSNFKKETKYLVLSYKDIKASGFTEADDTEMYRLLNMVALARAQRGKPPMECVVVESDWRCYDNVWKMLEMEHNHNITDGVILCHAEPVAHMYQHDETGRNTFVAMPDRMSERRWYEIPLYRAWEPKK